YNVIIKSKAILDEVAEELGLNDSEENLEDKIEVSSEEDSQVVTVTVKDPDAQQATSIANTTVKVFQDRIPDLMNVDNDNSLRAPETEVDLSPVEPRPKLDVGNAIVVRGLVGVGVGVLLEYLETTIRTVEEGGQKLDGPDIRVISSLGAEDINAQRS